MSGPVTIITYNPEATRRLGSAVASLLKGGETICLHGTLGAGKTTFAQGIGDGLGIKEPIISPTFTLIREYAPANGHPPMYHIDFYRLECPDEIRMLGLDDYFYGGGICVVEWPERAESLLPKERLWIDMHIIGDNERSLSIHAVGESYRAFLSPLRKLVERV